MKNKNKNKKLELAFLFLIFCLTLAMLLFMRRESDYFWHIKAGEYMFKNGILKKDIFSWFVKGKYWFSHEWLFEIILYSIKLVFGKFHILVYGFGCFLTLLLFIFYSNKKNFFKNVPFSLLWLTLFLIMIVFAQARPHLISFNFLALTIYLLFDLYKNEDSKKIFFLPLIAILWANIHGGSSNLSYIFCFIFMICGLFKFNFGKIEASRISKKQFFKYLVVMFLCIGGILINIHGIKMLLYPYTNMMDTLMIENISEWRATNLNDFAHLPYFLLCFVILLVFLISKKKISFIDFVLFICVLFLGLKSIRFWAYTYIVMSFVVFNYVEERKLDKHSEVLIFIVSFMFLTLFLVNYKYIYRNINAKVLDKEVINILKKEKPQRLYNMYDYGGELISNNIEVFIDGRADLYSSYNYKDYLNISKLENDYVKLINKYDFDYFLVDDAYPIYTYLEYSNDYEKIYDKKMIAIFRKLHQ